MGKDKRNQPKSIEIKLGKDFKLNVSNSLTGVLLSVRAAKFLNMLDTQKQLGSNTN